MFNGYLKALIVQSLFFCAHLNAQSLYFEKPEAGPALENDQDIVVGVKGTTPTRVELYLNGLLLMARKRPPFRFTIHWDTNRTNVLKAVGYYSDHKPISVTRTYREIRADYQETVAALQCFPFLEAPPERWALRSRGKVVQPRTFEIAAKFPLNMVIVLDISGSMTGLLETLSSGATRLAEWLESEKITPRLVVFDQEPRLREGPLPQDLGLLYKGVARSVVWDALAAANELPRKGPRLVVLLISDGADDGSRHDGESVAHLFEKSGASLIWVNPDRPRNRDLARLAENSGGFIFQGGSTGFWDALIRRLDLQYHLLAPDAAFPIELTVSPGSVWYPRWRE